MESKLVWLILILFLHWAFCVFYGVKGAFGIRTTQSYFLANRGLSPCNFTLATTAMTLTAVFLIGHPGMIYRSGIPYGLISLCAIAIPLTGVLLVRRQWMLSKRFGYITLGEMLSHYFESNLIRAPVVLIALLFAIPFFGFQLAVGGWLLTSLTNNAISVSMGMWLLGGIIATYSAMGGLRGLAEMDSVHCVLMLLTIVVIGLVMLGLAGGAEALHQMMLSLNVFDPDYVRVSSWLDSVATTGSGTDNAWSGTLILSLIFAFMGIQLTPGFTMLGFAHKNPATFANQQLVVTSVVVGFILIVFSTIQGMTGHFLGADAVVTHQQPHLVNALMVEGLKGNDLMRTEGMQDRLVPQVLLVIQDSAPWLAAALLLGLLAGIHASAVFVFAAAVTVVRDAVAPFMSSNFNFSRQIWYTRICVVILVFVSLIAANQPYDSLIFVAALAGAYALQLLPSLVAVCWWPWLTRPGCIAGMVAGVIAVTCTDSIGQDWFSITAWKRWPWSVHSAAWGIGINLLVTVLISAISQNKLQRAHRKIIHRFLCESLQLSGANKYLRVIAWIMVVCWFYFAVGPGAVIGNHILGLPDQNSPQAIGLFSLWLWQLIWWALGVYMIWFLACKMGLSSPPTREIQPLCDDIRDIR